MKRVGNLRWRLARRTVRSSVEEAGLPLALTGLGASHTWPGTSSLRWPGRQEQGMRIGSEVGLI